MADSKEKLFSDFPGVSTEAWMEKITADLKGADFEKKLVWKTNEGFKVKPFYRQEDLEGLWEDLCTLRKRKLIRLRGLQLKRITR